MTAVGLGAIGLGLVMIWAGIKDESLRDVLGAPFGRARAGAPSADPAEQTAEERARLEQGLAAGYDARNAATRAAFDRGATGLAGGK